MKGLVVYVKYVQRGFEQTFTLRYLHFFPFVKLVLAKVERVEQMNMQKLLSVRHAKLLMAHI